MISMKFILNIEICEKNLASTNENQRNITKKTPDTQRKERTKQKTLLYINAKKQNN